VPSGEYSQIAGLLCAIILTLAVFSRLLGDNPIFRFAQSLFIGTASGYILALILRLVLWPRVLLLIQQPAQYWYYGIYMFLGLLLLTRGFRQIRGLGSLPLGALFGIGAAVTLGGSLAGTLLPQTRAVIPSFTGHPSGWQDWAWLINGILMMVSTLAVLGVYRHTPAGHGVLGIPGAIWSFLGRTLGHGLLMVLLGALYAGALVSFYTLLVNRFVFLQHTISTLLGYLRIA